TNSNPFIVTNLRNDYDNTIVPYQISGATTSGFWAVFSNTINTSGYYLDTVASDFSSLTTGFATTVIVNITNGAITTGTNIQVTG
ncbi:hypothetical protein ABK046_49255, partial [Streptomyces caeruleatus]